jgi:hypothetical protein
MADSADLDDEDRRLLILATLRDRGDSVPRGLTLAELEEISSQVIADYRQLYPRGD